MPPLSRLQLFQLGLLKGRGCMARMQQQFVRYQVNKKRHEPSFPD